MTVIINGEVVEIRERLSLAELLWRNGVAPDQKGFAVALNDEVITKSRWKDVLLQDGDRLEIIRATQGG
ncbi:MAG: sulfur carrier protein ThiS [Bryobacteraceae bacterium]|nr:sulfur carrier protein ThiS [Bryobacteraceae bacterium]MDW8380479.1 sulfur carrier protein ThiS [Bryobacterales bacterium]MDW8436402.1 sulfur carrier protein ThiS [Chloroherpetonaceae bacterium]